MFVTLPNVFNQMPLGQLWGTLFFVFMSFAALSTIIAVFENLITFTMEKWDLDRKRALARTAVLVTVLSLPCAWFQRACRHHHSGHRRHSIHRGLHRVEQPAALGQSAVRGILRIAQRLGLGQLPCRGRCGHGHEVPALARGWLTFGLPALIIIIFIMGYVPKIMMWAGLA